MENILFIVGSGRSGTTWLHLMLGSHPKIATGQESQLFNNYFSPLVKQWDTELNYPKTSDLRFHGISAYIKEPEFYRLLSDFAKGVFNTILAEKPSANWLLEKSPNNSHHIPTIQKCFPKAKYIHLIRDGRDVAASILSAKKSWGRYWSHQTVEDAANDWQTSLNAARQAQSAEENYIEVRYEDLLANGPETMSRIFQFLDIETTPEEIEALYAEFSFNKLKASNYNKNIFINPGDSTASGTESRAEPKEFFRKGISGDWKTFFQPNQLREFYWTAGNLLHELGYEDAKITTVRKPFHLKVRHRVQALRKLASAILRKLTGMSS